jgi:hypothetical protein
VYLQIRKIWINSRSFLKKERRKRKRRRRKREKRRSDPKFITHKLFELFDLSL